MWPCYLLSICTHSYTLSLMLLTLIITPLRYWYTGIYYMHVQPCGALYQEEQTAAMQGAIRCVRARVCVSVLYYETGVKHIYLP